MVTVAETKTFLFSFTLRIITQAVNATAAPTALNVFDCGFRGVLRGGSLCSRFIKNWKMGHLGPTRKATAPLKRPVPGRWMLTV